MPEQTITIGNKQFDVACQPGEEHYLEAAAKMLDAEAQTLLSQIGRVPSERMLLMAGLMLADKTAAAEDRQRLAENEVAALKSELRALRERPAPEPAPEPETVQVAVVPDEVTSAMAELAARAEALAEHIDRQGRAEGS